MTSFSVTDAQLTLSGTALLGALSSAARVEIDPTATGVFLRAEFERPRARFVGKLGTLLGVKRFLACHRYEPFWMAPKVGEHCREIPEETQFLLLELEAGKYAVLVPLIDAPFRVCLGTEQGSLTWTIESGDPYLSGSSARAVFLAVGDDAYDLVERSARAVATCLGSRLRTEKPLPAFADSFGWCTWDAFYQTVSQDRVREGLEAFKRCGVSPKMMILDDGWQSERQMPTEERRLTSFAANQKFPGGLAPTVNMAKAEYGIQTFLVWHAIHGYWGGVDGEALQGYGVVDKLRAYSPGILRFAPSFNQDYWGPVVGMIPPSAIGRFYDDYHRDLRAQGVDGVKVDNQASSEGLAHGLGGRVALMHAYRAGLEDSVGTHFSGNLINCMSLSNEMLYSANRSTLTRSSTDFWPDRPESHGLHLYTNACFGVWFGQFVHPDWDMFQSGHARGAFHAAGRAVSGSPVYVSDKPDQHDAAVLHKLVTSDGSVLRAQHVGRPTPDCLFRDPTREAVLLKIFNFNVGSAVIGVFHARHSSTENEPLSGSVSTSDIPGLDGSDFVAYCHTAGSLVRLKRGAALLLTLAEREFEIVTLVPLDRGVAPVGLTDKYNSAGAITEKGWQTKSYVLGLRDRGEFLAFSEHRPRAVRHRGQPQSFTWQLGQLRVSISTPGPAVLSIDFD